MFVVLYIILTRSEKSQVIGVHPHGCVFAGTRELIPLLLLLLLLHGPPAQPPHGAARGDVRLQATQHAPFALEVSSLSDLEIFRNWRRGNCTVKSEQFTVKKNIKVESHPGAGTRALLS